MNQSVKTLQELAEIIGAEVVGDPTAEISSVAPLATARPGQLSFLDNIKYRDALEATQASGVILSKENTKYFKHNMLVMDNPSLGLAKVLTLFQELPNATPGIHPTAVVEDDAQVHATASVGAQCVIGKDSIIGEGVVLHPGVIVGEKCTLGAHCTLWSNVVLYYGVTLGDHVVIHSGTIIGADGFGYAHDGRGYIKIPQVGSVRIGNHVEIGANTTIDRGAMHDTCIGDGVILDNQIQIAHNVVIKEHTAMAGCTAVAGSVTIGAHCRIGGGCCIAGHIEIADKVMLTGMSAVNVSIDKPGAIYAGGLPAKPFREWTKIANQLLKIDEMAKRLKALERTLDKTQTEK